MSLFLTASQNIVLSAAATGGGWKNGHGQGPIKNATLEPESIMNKGFDSQGSIFFDSVLSLGVQRLGKTVTDAVLIEGPQLIRNRTLNTEINTLSKYNSEERFARLSQLAAQLTLTKDSSRRQRGEEEIMTLVAEQVIMTGASIYAPTLSLDELDYFLPVMILRSPEAREFSTYRLYRLYRSSGPMVKLFYRHYLEETRQGQKELGPTYHHLRRQFWMADLNRLRSLTTQLHTLQLQGSHEAMDMLARSEGLALKLEAEAKLFPSHPVTDDPTANIMPKADQIFDQLWRFFHNVHAVMQSEGSEMVSDVKESYQRLESLFPL